MSWHSEATTTSSSAPARSARVAVCRECVSWSVAKPSVMLLQRAQHVEDPLRDPVLVLERLGADDGPLLGGRLVHAGEGGRRRHASIVPATWPDAQPRAASTSAASMLRSFAAGRAASEPPRVTVAASSTAASRSRRLRGGGKYSSSSVNQTSSDASTGARRAMTASTSSSGADAPAVTPTVPARSSGSSSAVVDPEDPRAARLRGPAARGPGCSTSWPSRCTTMASQRSAIFSRPDWRLVVAKHRSLRPGIHRSGKRSWRRRARRPSRGGRAWSGRAGRRARRARGARRRPRPRSTRWMASGATAIVPTASSWPSWPT